MLPNVSTAVIIMELRNRVSDQLYDLEPKYDASLTGINAEFLTNLYHMLDTFTPEPEEV
jgi:hypothetical protein